MIDVMLCLPVGGRRGGRRAWVLIDAADKPRFDEKRWFVRPRGYIIGQSGRRDPQIFLHRWLVGLQPGDRRQVDHINRRPNDNRRCNLRIVSHRENGGNHPGWSRASSRHRGVCWRKDTRKWAAFVQIDGRLHNLGSFDDENEAAAVARNYRLAHLPGAVD